MKFAKTGVLVALTYLVAKRLALLAPFTDDTRVQEEGGEARHPRCKS